MMNIHKKILAILSQPSKVVLIVVVVFFLLVFYGFHSILNYNYEEDDGYNNLKEYINIGLSVARMARSDGGINYDYLKVVKPGEYSVFPFERIYGRYQLLLANKDGSDCKENCPSFYIRHDPKNTSYKHCLEIVGWLSYSPSVTKSEISGINIPKTNESTYRNNELRKMCKNKDHYFKVMNPHIFSGEIGSLNHAKFLYDMLSKMMYSDKKEIIKLKDEYFEAILKNKKWSLEKTEVGFNGKHIFGDIEFSQLNKVKKECNIKVNCKSLQVKEIIDKDFCTHFVSLVLKPNLTEKEKIDIRIDELNQLKVEYLEDVYNLGFPTKYNFEVSVNGVKADFRNSENICSQDKNEVIIKLDDYDPL